MLLHVVIFMREKNEKKKKYPNNKSRAKKQKERLKCTKYRRNVVHTIQEKMTRHENSSVYS